jgi:hypothetical protein
LGEAERGVVTRPARGKGSIEEARSRPVKIWSSG